MQITEPKRIFDATLKLTENNIANTGDKKWIISDLWISNSADAERKVTLKAGYQGAYDEVKRNLLSDILLQPKQTVILGNIILEPNETLYAYADGEIHAHCHTDFDGDDNDLVFISKESGAGGNNITLEVINPQEINQPLSCNVDGKNISVTVSTKGTTVPQKAALTTALFDPNNDLTFISKAFGSDSNNISIEYIKPSPNTPLSIAVDGWDLIITLGTDSNGNVITTASQLRDYINNNQKLVDTSLAEGNDGTGFVRELSKSYLLGGVDATVTTTANDIIDLLKTNKALDDLIYIEREQGSSGEGIIKHITVEGTHSNKVNLSKGDVNRYDPHHYGITGIDIVGYGRVI